MERAALQTPALRVLRRSIWRRRLPSRRYESTLRIHKQVPLSKENAFPTAIPVFRQISEVRAARKPLRQKGCSLGFVPTMGALHEGHLSLVRHALQENSHVIVSIFVNPTQFAAHEDLDSYPVTWEEDMAKLKRVENEFAGMKPRPFIRAVFAPTVKSMYPTLPPTSDIAGHGSFVTITPLGTALEGASRPIFFRGVATVCTKLFNIVQPDTVYFGQKDVQQSVLIRRMVRDFHIPTQVRVIPTTREPDGLAMSSRNVYLGDKRREDATVLSRALFASRDLYQSGVLQVGRLRGAAKAVFEEDQRRTRKDGRVGPAGRIEVDYLAMTDIDTMATVKDNEDLNPNIGAVLSAAMIVSPVDNPRTREELDQKTVRLIDNVRLESKVDKLTRKHWRQQAAQAFNSVKDKVPVDSGQAFQSESTSIDSVAAMTRDESETRTKVDELKPGQQDGQ